MALVDALKPLLGNNTVKVTLEVMAHPKDPQKLAVTAKPVTQPVPDNASEQLKMLMAGLAMPIKVVAEPETLEAELAGEINKAQQRRSAWEQQADALDAAIAQQQADSTGQSDQGQASAQPSQPATASTTEQPAQGEQAGADASGEDDDQFALDSL